MPGNYQKESTQHLEKGKSLKSRVPGYSQQYNGQGVVLNTYSKILPFFMTGKAAQIFMLLI
jgi:hypothetical protein